MLATRRIIQGIHTLLSRFLTFALANLLLSQAGLAQNMNVQRIGNSMAVISGSGTNILVKQVAGNELIVVDGGHAEYADATAETIAEAFGLDSFTISLLFNTHWHPEQTGLNAKVFGTARIFAHENTRQWLTTPVTRPWDGIRIEPLPENAQPNETFFHYGELTHGDTEMLYGYLRQAHTDGDMYVYFPEENVLHAGGVIENTGWPLMDWWTGGWIGGLANSLEVLLEIINEDTVIVPANGQLMTWDDLVAMREMYATIFERISTGFRNANSVDDTLAEMPTAEFDNQFGDPEQFIRRSHESLIPHYTPDA